MIGSYLSGNGSLPQHGILLNPCDNIPFMNWIKSFLYKNKKLLFSFEFDSHSIHTRNFSRVAGWVDHCLLKKKHPQKTMHIIYDRQPQNDVQYLSRYVSKYVCFLKLCSLSNRSQVIRLNWGILHLSNPLPQSD